MLLWVAACTQLILTWLTEKLVMFCAKKEGFCADMSPFKGTVSGDILVFYSHFLFKFVGLN
jgi:hypothetical protein